MIKRSRILYPIFANFIYLIFSYALLSNQNKIDIRFALFSKIVTRKEFLQLKDSILIKKELMRKDFLNKYEVNDSLTFEDSVYKVLHYFKPYKSDFGCGVYSNYLKLNINNVLKGNGCCSDFSQVFIAICNQNRLNTCEISNSNHTFCEVANGSNTKKIWIDVENKIFAKDQNGNFLSTMEIYDNFRLNKKIELYKYIDKGKFVRLINSNLFNKDAYKYLILTINNHILYQDEINQKYNFQHSMLSENH